MSRRERDQSVPATVRRTRYREIAAILSRHGLHYLVERVDRRAEGVTAPEHIRSALEELGPTFVKLGQLLSTRADLLPPSYLAELTKLQDAAAPFPAEEAHAAVAEELGQPVEDVFASFEPAPIAAASIGQAHAATLHDGTAVVVKVRRPGVVQEVNEDLEIFQNIAARAARHWPAAADYDIVGAAEDFARTLRAELDYLAEGRNAGRFAANFAGERDVHIPQVYWEMTTSRVLTLERIGGIKINDLAGLDAAGVGRRALAERATRITAKMIFEDGFFHGDPHPGNLFVEEGGRIGMIDFGMVGSINDRLQRKLADLLIAFTQQDADRITDVSLELAVTQQHVDRAAFQDDVAGLLRRYGGLGIGEISIARVIGDALAVMRRHHLQIPRDLALMLRVLVMDQGIAADLDPGFQLQEELTPYARRLMAQQLAPEELLRRLPSAIADAAQLGVELPEQARRLLRAAEAGELPLRIRREDLEPALRRVERVGNRVVAAILVSSLLEVAGAFATRRGLRRRR